MIKKITALLLCLLAQQALSETYSGYGIVTGLTVGAGYARVRTTAMANAEGCSDQSWYLLAIDPGEGKEMYSALLAAKASGQRVRFQLIGCSGAYPNITHVYMCENAQCT